MESEKVKEIYEKHPYPKRDPENTKLKGCTLFNPKYINVHVWGGKKDFNNFTVIDIGCGTGDCVLSIAEKLKDTNAKIIGLDISKSALEIAKKRAEKLGLDNIEWVQESVLNLDNLGIEYDYALSSSVLAHLEEPKEGYRIIGKQLKKNGGAGFRSYGKYGRYPVHMMQEAWDMIGGKDDEEKVDNAIEIANSLPPFHPYKIVPINYMVDIRYDAVLTRNTHPFSVYDIFEVLEYSDMSFLRFGHELQYQPQTYLKGKFKEKLEKMSDKERFQLGELLNGTMAHHNFFATKKGFTPHKQDIEDESLVPVFFTEIKKGPIPEHANAVFKINKGRMKYQIMVDRKYKAMLDLIDGKNSIKDIVESIAKGGDVEKAKNAWKSFAFPAIGLDILGLKLP